MLIFVALALVVDCLKVLHSFDGINYSERGNLGNDGMTNYRVTSAFKRDLENKSNYYIKIQGKSEFIQATPIAYFNFYDEFTILKDTTGEIIHISYSPVASTSQNTEFETTINVITTENGPRPMMEQAVTKQEIATGSQSFIIKYWYIIVPALLFLVLTSPEEEKK
jgi:hypothetical protein